MSDHQDDVAAIRKMVAPLESVEMSELSSRRVRKRAMAAMRETTPTGVSRFLRALRRLEPALAFAVGAVYMSLTLHTLLSGY